jgi:hypothetical protein
MMIIRICSGIVHMGELAFVKKEFRERGGRQAKYDFVSDIDWTEVSAGDISCKPVLWGMVYGNEFFNAYDSAVRQHWSWAEFFMHWEKRSAQQEISKDYLKQAQDSLFRAEDEPFTYGLSWNRAEEISFRIVDLNMVMDWDDDGYSDRILRWYAEQGSGICWVTRKGVDQQIDFFEVKDAKEK